MYCTREELGLKAKTHYQPGCWLPFHLIYMTLVSTRTLIFSSVQSLSHVWLFVTPRPAACQASLSINNSWSLLKLMSTESVMPFNHLMLCHPFFLLLQFCSRVFSKESIFCIRWSKYWKKSSVLPMNIQDWSPLRWIGGSPFSPRDSRVSNTTVQKHQFFGVQLSL